MLLTVDVGNTNITLGVYDGDKLLFVSRMSTKPLLTEDQYAADILAILNLYKVEAEQIDGAVLSSVVPSLTGYLTKAIERFWKIKPYVVSAETVPEVTVIPGMVNSLGADLIVGAAAAKALYPCPSIVIDMGTATTLTGINRKGEVCGVVILPGLNTSLDALTSGAAQLSAIPLQAPNHVLGTNTVECIQSGMIHGTACMLDGLCDRIEAEIGEPCTVVATGGLAGMVIAHCRRKILFSDMLLLDGLKLIWENHKR